MEPLRLCVRERQPCVGDQHRRRRHHRACILRPRGSIAAAGARVAEAPLGADAAEVDPPGCPIPGPSLVLGAPASRRRHPADGCSRDPDAGRPRLDPGLANPSVRTVLASSERKEGLTCAPVFTCGLCSRGRDPVWRGSGASRSRSNRPRVARAASLERNRIARRLQDGEVEVGVGVRLVLQRVVPPFKVVPLEPAVFHDGTQRPAIPGFDAGDATCAVM